MISQKLSLCFVFSFAEMPTVISDIRLTVLVNIKISFHSIYLMLFFLILSFEEIFRILKFLDFLFNSSTHAHILVNEIDR